MSRLPKELRKRLKKEGKLWDNTIAREDAEQVQKLLDVAESFKVPRPVRQPVSLRMDPFDISMIKRLARKKGIPHSQLIALWLHERVEQEKKLFVSK
jgi:predicted DNA binding CopG/RHH family protein